MSDASVITGIDHPVIAVRDMARGRAAYERLGFTVTPRGRHLEWGTGNWCIMFQRDYLELRGIVDSAAQNPAHRIPDRDGLMGLAFGTDDAEVSFAELTRRGLHPQPVKRLTRNFEIPEGTVQPRFALCFLNAEETPGLMSVVLCQHLTPELLRRPEWLRHANAALGVRRVTGVVSDLVQAAESLARLFGKPALSHDDDRIVVGVRQSHTIELLTPGAARKHWAWNDASRSDADDYLLSISIAVEDPQQTSQCLSDRGVAFRNSSGGSICVEPREACGVPIEFTDSMPTPA